MAGRTDLEQLVYQMSTDIRALERQNKRALVNVDTTANKIEARYKKVGKADLGKFLDQTFDRSRLAAFEVGAARVPIFGQALEALGPAGLAAAAGIGATALAVTGALQAMQFADEIDDTSTRLNIGAEALQEYRFAMTEVGGEAKDAETAIEGFQKKLGEGIAGGRAVKWFERLGFSAADLKAFDSTEEALDAVLNKISTLGRESERAAVAEKLGLGPMIVLAREGAGRLDELRQKARDLGVVMDADLVKRAADANQQFEVMSRVIDVQLKGALVDIGPVLVSLMGLVAGLARGLNGLADSWRSVDNRSTEGLRAQAQRLAERREFISDLAGDRPNGLQQGSIDRLTAERNRILAELRSRAERPTPGAAPTGGLVDVSGGGGGSSGSRSSGPSADEIASRRTELERTLAIEIARLSNNEALVQVLEREAAIARRTEQYEGLKLSSAVARTQALADQTLIDEARRDGQVEEVRILQQQKDVEDARMRGDERVAQTIQDRIDLQREIESLISKGFDSVSATATAESNLLDVQRARAEITARIVADAALERQLTLAQIAGDEQRVRVLERALEIGRRARQIEGDRGLNFGDGAGTATAQVDEEIAAASRRGFRDGVRGMLDDLQDGGLEGVLSGVFGKVSDRLKDNLADMLSNYLLRTATGPAGGAGAGGSGWAGQVANAALSLFGRRERGGSGRQGVPVIVGEKRPEVFVPGVDGSILPSLSALGRGGGVQSGSRTTVDFRQTIDLRGANGDATIRDIAYRAAAEGSAAAYAAALADGPAKQAHRRRYSRS